MGERVISGQGRSSEVSLINSKPETLTRQGVEFQLASTVAMIPWSMTLGLPKDYHLVSSVHQK